MPLKLIKQELKSNNCGFHHDPVDSMVRSQWQSTSKNHFYLIYRWLVAVFVVAVVIIALESHLKKSSIDTFFIYLTRWGILLNMIVGVFGAILVTIWHFHSDFHKNVLENDRMPIAFKIYWALHNVAFVSAFTITIVYWTVIHNNKRPISLASFLTHAMNSVIMFMDILIVSYPVRLYHVIHPIFFGMCYAMFSYMYYLCGGVNREGKSYVYKVLDWNHPKKAMSTVIAVWIVLFIVHVALFCIYKLRVSIRNRFVNTKLNLVYRNVEITPQEAQTSDIFYET